METKKYFAVHDSYTENRGGYSRFLTICCNVCKHPVLLYQKDGLNGPLLRMYLDRIRAPEKLVDSIKNYTDKIQAGDLTCPHCNHILATAIDYKKENRLAYRIFVGAIEICENKKGLFPLRQRINLKDWFSTFFS
jgi:ribosomal protein S27E